MLTTYDIVSSTLSDINRPAKLHEHEIHLVHEKVAGAGPIRRDELGFRLQISDVLKDDRQLVQHRSVVENQRRDVAFRVHGQKRRRPWPGPSG